MSVYLTDTSDHLFTCDTLELSWVNNETGVSSIPPGVYRARKYNSPSKGKVLKLDNVSNRDFIEIHAGNYYTQIKGCILVGDDLRDINGDGYLDVVNSRDTLSKLLDVIYDTDEVKIIISQ